MNRFIKFQPTLENFRARIDSRIFHLERKFLSSGEELILNFQIMVENENTSVHVCFFFEYSYGGFILSLKL